MIQNAFRRAVALILQKPDPHAPTIVPVSDIKRYLLLDRKELAGMGHFPVRINRSLRINDFQRPGLTLGFESNPDAIVSRRLKPDIGDPYEESIPASPAIIYTDYKELLGRHHFAIILHPRIEKFGDELLPVFGLSGHYREDGRLNVETIILPSFDAQRRLTGSNRVPVTTENLEFAMTFARLCAGQVYAARPLTIQNNYTRAEKIAGTGTKGTPAPSP